ncbi:hypothetical protein K7432_003905 [Basidiobolus ranarum]|uniref:SUN domain-containing protein n=1 Tax=Basidiobolus ranarum TaxID=34480 RepID=A0ABR2WZA9_9FUNG
MDEAATSEPSAMISKASSLTHIPGYSLPDREALQMKAPKENTTAKLPDNPQNYVPAKALPITTENPISGVPIVASAFTTAPIEIELPSHKSMHTQNLDPKIENTAQKLHSKQPSDSPDLRRSQEKDTAPYFLGGLPIQPHSRQLSLPDVKKYVAREELIPNENLKISTTSSELISDGPQDSKYSNTGVAPDNAANLVNIDDLPPGLASLVLEFLKSPTDWPNESVENVPTEDAPESTKLEAAQRNEVPPVVEEIKNEENNHSDTSLERYNSSANEDQESKLEYYELNVTGNVSKSTVIPPTKLIEMVTAKINVAAKEIIAFIEKFGWIKLLINRDWKKKINTIEQYINRGNKTTDDIPLNTTAPTVSPIIRPRSLSSVSYKIPESPNLSPSMGNSHWSSSLRLGSIFLENWSKRKVVKDECQTFETMYTDMRQKLAEMENRITSVSSVQKRAGQDIHSNYQEVKKISEIIDHQYYHQLKLLEDQMQRILDSRSNSYLQEFFFTILSYVLAATGYLFWIIAILFIMLKRVFSLPFLSASRKRKIEAKSH